MNKILNNKINFNLTRIIQLYLLYTNSKLTYLEELIMKTLDIKYNLKITFV